jgi:hypothetical protein
MMFAAEYPEKNNAFLGFLIHWLRAINYVSLLLEKTRLAIRGFQPKSVHHSACQAFSPFCSPNRVA